MNTLYYGDNLDVLPRIASESVDLIYLDPPFNSNATYNILFRTLKGDPSSAQIHAFDDTWSWSVEAEATYHRVTSAPSAAGGLVVYLRSMFAVLGKSDLMAYLVMMAPRLVELRRVLNPAGSIYLHCDPTASHYLKTLMDAVFGVKNYRNEIVWCYAGGGIPRKDFPRKHDVILRYTKTDDYFYDPTYRPYSPGTVQRGRTKVKGKYFEEGLRAVGTPINDWWTDVPKITSPTDPEKLGYPTQKPVVLLERIIKTSCPEAGIVLDPFCGCGTTVDAAQQMGRSWIGIDITYIAVDLIKNRLTGRYGDSILSTFHIDGIPQDVEGANALSNENKIDFERWAVSMVRGQPTKASGDEGVDGKIYFARTYKEPLDVGTCIVSVKAGEHLGPEMVRELAGTVSGREAQMGLLLTRVPASDGMLKEAVRHGSYIHEATGALFPRIQLLTTGELLAGTQPKIPSPLPPYQQASWAPGSEAMPLF
jgi:site-specific DNA-methyltransferase (adenine-specific)